MPTPSPRPDLAAVVFDCDGLLLDTESCWTAAESALFGRYGQSFGVEEKQALIGMSIEAGGRVLERLLAQEGRAGALSAELLDLVAFEVSKGAAPLAGAVELVSELRGRVPLAVASNSPRALLMSALGSAGLDEAFNVYLGGDDVANPKPAPDIYLEACLLLGVKPAHVVAFEDSPTGVAAARVAGVYVIGVPSVPGVTLEADLVAGALSAASLRSALGLG